MATPKQAHALVSYFSKVYKEKYKIEPVVNRYSARWGFDAMLMDLSIDEVKELIDYYMSTINTSGHTLAWFFSNYEKLVDAKVKAEKDAAALAVIRERTRIRTEEWRKKNGNN